MIHESGFVQVMLLMVVRGCGSVYVMLLMIPRVRGPVQVMLRSATPTLLVLAAASTPGSLTPSPRAALRQLPVAPTPPVPSAASVRVVPAASAASAPGWHGRNWCKTIWLLAAKALHSGP